MNRFLIALMILSVVVMTQSVVAVTPTPTVELQALSDAAGLVAGQPDVAAIGGLPDPPALFLLLAGLSGIVVAGSRPTRGRESA